MRLRVISRIESLAKAGDPLNHTKKREKQSAFFLWASPCLTVGLLPRSYESLTAAMIRSILIALIWVNLSTALSAQPKSSKPPIELTAEIISQSYCSVNADASALEIKLRLGYRNTGKQRIILYNGHDSFYQTRIRSAPGNPSGPYEVWVTNSRYFDEQPEAIDQTSPGKIFITLAPGAVYRREIMIGVVVMIEKVDRGDSSIRVGDHTVQLITSNWYQSRTMAQKLRQQWQSKGLLWSEPLDSRPITFRAQRPAALAPCR